MTWNKNLGVNVSMFFLLALTILVVTVYHVANGALEKLNSDNSSAEINAFL